MAGHRPEVILDGPPAAAVADLERLQAEISQLRDELAQLKRRNGIIGDAADQFLTDLVHDLKNPLAAIRINVQGLQRTLDKGVPPRPDQLQDRLTRMESMVNQALEQLIAARSRASARTAPTASIRRESLDLVHLVQDVVEHIRSLAGPGRLRLAVKCGELIGAWDPQQLRRAIEALIDNALKFSGPDAETVVNVRRAGNAAEISVEDRGIGIPASDIPHVCERFYRGGNVLGRYKGAGMGLFEANNVVVGHQGQLLIQSLERRGSTVTINLPME